MCKTEQCRIVDIDEYGTLGYPFSAGGQVWEICSDITYDGEHLELVLYLDFPPEFPLMLPKLYLERSIYDAIKYIPHINKDCSICIFDEGMNTLIPKSNLPYFVDFILHRGKRIVKDGENEDFRIEEFRKEFKAYWDLEYSEKDKVYLVGLHSISGTGKEVKAIGFQNQTLAGYHYFLYTEDDEREKIEKYAEARGSKIKEMAVLEIDFEKVEPPFQMSYRESLEHIRGAQDKIDAFKNLCKAHSLSDILVIFRNQNVGAIEYYGWIYEDVIVQPRKFSGIRRKPSNFQIVSESRWAETMFVQRLTFDNLGEQRLSKRAAGVIEQKHSVLCTGLGSVGSNLIYFLKNLPVNHFGLIDPEQLKVENIKRNLLGFRSTNKNKVDVLADFLMDHYPGHEIEKRQASVTTVINQESDFINKFDIHIVAVGKTMVEEFILKKVELGILTKPLLLLWVEPYLASGQLLLVKPEDAGVAAKLVKKFDYAVVSNEDTPQQAVYLIEGSCQSGYFPYSSTFLTHFLSAVFPVIKDAVLQGVPKSEVYTWIGDKEFAKSQGLVLTEFGEAHPTFSLIRNDIK
ncbi:hypothetical protein DX873_12885 [Flagellimonas nanhaiensis]|uniref:Uncharacterized protein n=1 Tax=Flagellimonas nanhaiensis TaxID=2292706 RepID=A0A371JRU0_9FLAO|nr:hypothetical protein DX873_12885 [Allomuricauda nanhaiensis]